MDARKRQTNADASLPRHLAGGKRIASLRYDDASSLLDTNDFLDVFASDLPNGVSYAVGRSGTNRACADMRLVHLARGDSPSLSSDGVLMAFSSQDESLDPHGINTSQWSEIW